MSNRHTQTLLELRVSSVGAVATNRVPTVRWSEIWGISLHAGQPFIVTEEQLRLPQTGAPKKICMFTLEDGRLHCTIIDRARETRINQETKAEAICGPGDRIVIGGAILVEILRAPAAPAASETPSIAATFEHGLENIFRTLEDGLAIPPLLEEATGLPVPIDGPPRGIFGDHRAIEVPEAIEPVAPPKPAAKATPVQAFSQIAAVPLVAHRPDDFLRARTQAHPRPRISERRRPMPVPVRKKSRVSVWLLVLLGVSLALFVSER